MLGNFTLGKGIGMAGTTILALWFIRKMGKSSIFGDFNTGGL